MNSQGQLFRESSNSYETTHDYETNFFPEFYLFDQSKVESRAGPAGVLPDQLIHTHKAHRNRKSFSRFIPAIGSIRLVLFVCRSEQFIVCACGVSPQQWPKNMMNFYFHSVTSAVRLVVPMNVFCYKCNLFWLAANSNSVTVMASSPIPILYTQQINIDNIIKLFINKNISLSRHVLLLLLITYIFHNSPALRITLSLRPAGYGGTSTQPLSS